jgi:cytidine deaminase
MRSKAESLVNRDEEESDDKYGQRLRKTYPLGDLFIDTTTSRDAVKKMLERFVDLIFGHVWTSPSVDEQGMALAYMARLRSASPARQVGAALTTERGAVLSIGTNEAAMAGGGQYWEGDIPDGRDHAMYRTDRSDVMRRNVLIDLLKILDRLRPATEGQKDLESLAIESSGHSIPPELRKALLFNTIDFQRNVHAEAAALLASKDLPIPDGATLYVTTFPCHECARHIVIAGVKKVRYIEPYPKSLVNELYGDSIGVEDATNPNTVHFLPFSGISPTVYTMLFTAATDSRKSDSGDLTVWKKKDQLPRFSPSYSWRASEAAEKDVLDEFNKRVKAKGWISGS